jgi:hypothetical protein
MMTMLASGIPGDLIFVVVGIPLIAVLILAFVNFVFIVRYARGSRGWHVAVLCACALVMLGLFANSGQKTTLTDMLLLSVPVVVVGQFVWLLRTREKWKCKMKPR